MVKPIPEKLGLEALFQRAGNDSRKSQCGVTPCQSRATTPRIGTSQVVQWLRLQLPMQRVWFRSLVEELRFPHALWPKDQNINRSSIGTNSMKTLKMVHIKKTLKKEHSGSISEPKFYVQSLLVFSVWAIGSEARGSGLSKQGSGQCVGRACNCRSAGKHG